MKNSNWEWLRILKIALVLLKVICIVFRMLLYFLELAHIIFKCRKCKIHADLF